MLGHCRVAAAFACLRVTHYAFAFEQDLDAAGADARFDLPAHQHVWHAVEAAVDLDVIVDFLITLRRNRVHHRPNSRSRSAEIGVHVAPKYARDHVAQVAAVYADRPWILAFAPKSSASASLSQN